MTAETCLPDYPDDSPFWATYQESDGDTGSIYIPPGCRILVLERTPCQTFGRGTEYDTRVHETVGQESLNGTDEEVTPIIADY